MLGPDGMPIEEDYLVQWVDQGNLRQQLEFTGVPTSRQIWVTQEDLWVYETLLHVIADTNKERGATRPDNTAIRVIQSLEVGAAGGDGDGLRNRTILMPADAMACRRRSAMPREMRMRAPKAAPVEGADVDAMLLAGRYIDAEGKPIADASAGMGDGIPPPAGPHGADDGRAVDPEGAVECANAPLPIEVQRLRINREKSGVDKDESAFELAAGAGGGPGMGMEGPRRRNGCGVAAKWVAACGMGMPMGRGTKGAAWG